MKWVLCVWLASLVVKAAGNFTFTYDMAKRCKEHLCQDGYKYNTFYRVDAEDRRKIKKESDVMFQMHLAILAGSNGHILLSPVEKPVATDPVYEIVIGGGGNKFTELRRSLRRNARASAKTPGILSTIEFRAFYIKITEDGLIEFGKEGDELPIISYNDVNPLTIRYFSFAAWNGVEAKFLYDCPRPGDENTDATPNSEAIEPQLSNSDSLKRELLLNRDPAVPPGQTVEVFVAVQVLYFNYNAFDSKLTTGFSLTTSWIDNSLAWDPSKFNDTRALYFRQGQIWSPKFFVSNSDSTSALNPITPVKILTIKEGVSMYGFQAKVVTWCYDGKNMNQWPRDEYKCDVIIEPWEAHEKISLTQVYPIPNVKLNFADIFDAVDIGWEVTSKEIGIKRHINNTIRSNANDKHRNDQFIISLNLRRRATGLNTVLYIPLSVLLIFVLMSFWTEPLTLARVWFYTSTAIVICMGLCSIDCLMPCHTAPSILYLYITVLGGVLLALLVHVLLMTAVAERLCKSVVIQNLLMIQCFRTMFCLPVLKTCRIYESINEAYATPEEEESRPAVEPRNGTIEEMQSDTTEYSERKEIAEVIDKISFFTYSVVFAVMLALHF